MRNRLIPIPVAFPSLSPPRVQGRQSARCFVISTDSFVRRRANKTIGAAARVVITGSWMRPIITSLAQKFHLDDTHDSKRYGIEELNWATSWEQGRWLGGEGVL